MLNCKTVKKYVTPPWSDDCWDWFLDKAYIVAVLMYAVSCLISVLRLDNSGPLDLNYGGGAYFNPGVQGDNIQMTNYPGNFRQWENLPWTPFKKSVYYSVGLWRTSYNVEKN